MYNWENSFPALSEWLNNDVSKLYLTIQMDIKNLFFNRIW